MRMGVFNIIVLYIYIYIHISYHTIRHLLHWNYEGVHHEFSHKNSSFYTPSYNKIICYDCIPSNMELSYYILLPVARKLTTTLDLNDHSWLKREKRISISIRLNHQFYDIMLKKEIIKKCMRYDMWAIQHNP